MVSQAYFAWPIALVERIAPREERSTWYRLQMRQAGWFGAIATLVGLLALSWPLVASFLLPDPRTIVWLYVLAMLLDAALFVLWLVLAIRYSRRAGRGELFEIPLVARLTGTSLREP